MKSVESHQTWSFFIQIAPPRSHQCRTRDSRELPRRRATATGRGPQAMAGPKLHRNSEMKTMPLEHQIQLERGILIISIDSNVFQIWKNWKRIGSCWRRSLRSAHEILADRWKKTSLTNIKDTNSLRVNFPLKRRNHRCFKHRCQRISLDWYLFSTLRNHARHVFCRFFFSISWRNI